jgi:hypothetical protein
MAEEQPTHEPPRPNAQRDFEQRALRNVRGLVDRIEADESERRKVQKRVVGVLVAVLAVLGAVVVTTLNRKPGGTQEIVVAPAAKTPAR